MSTRLLESDFDDMWLNRTFDCCDDTDVTWDALLCTACSISRQFEAAVNDKENSSNLCFDCVLCFPNTLMIMVNIYLRFAVRNKFRIREHWTVTTATAACCLWCSVCQTYKELNVRGLYPGGTLFVPAARRMNDLGQPMEMAQAAPYSSYGATVKEARK